jgi:hypothetical protein
VSCGSAGSCLAGGYYADRPNSLQGFVATEANGAWGRATGVPGLAALNTGGGGGAEVRSVSCASAGSCAAGGFYSGQHEYLLGFVATEAHGTWGTATPVPGLAALATRGLAEVASVSCGSAGSCAAGGDYAGRGVDYQGFAAVERNGVWGTAIEVPGLAALSPGMGDAHVTSVSCGPAGSCAIGGYYLSDGRYQGFVAVETNGAWGTATEVPGLAALNAGGDAKVYSVSCAPAGGCVAGGSYSPASYGYQGFVTAGRDGR